MKTWSSAVFISVMTVRASLAATLVEDFSTFDHADLSNSTGVWNRAAGEARAQAFANGSVESTRPIDFGNGSDGVVNSSSGYVFNTDTHPNGYQFQSLSITGGTVTVVGSHPLIIRSMSGITIVPALQVNGGNGSNGSLSGLQSAGGSSVTCLARGGKGGAATATTAADGTDAVASNGTSEAGTKGLGQVGGWTSTSPFDATPATFTGPSNIDFDTNPNADFICGTSGAGGGAYSEGSEFASGGGGGGGGGILKLVAVGDIQVGATEAKGGDGGSGVALTSGSCSGNGMGGFGGVIFFQTLGNISTGIDPDVSGGNSGTACGTNIQVVYGYTRGDRNSANSAPSWATGSYTTEEVPSNLQSFVQSKAYDLGVLNASFTGETVTSTGAVTVTYAGSSDGVNFSAFSTLDSLNDRGYRYLKFRATFTNPASGNVAPKISGLTLQYRDLGLAEFDAKLFAGCGTLAATGRNTPSGPGSNSAGILFSLAGILVCYGISRLRLG